MAQPIKLIIDTDPGVDDAIAILMALANRDVEVTGLTTVGGNVHLARTTRNALAVLQAAKRKDIPVAKGASRPLQGKFKYAPQFHGMSGLPLRLPEPIITPVPHGAVEFLNHQMTSTPGKVVLLALGPVTNIAKLLCEHPYVMEQAKNIVIMGGAIDVPGNVTPYAEFNIFCDPIASEIVFSSGLPITLVDLRACRQVGIDREHALNLHSDYPLGQLASALLQSWFKKEPSRQRFEFYDPLAMAVALDPAIATTTKIDINISLDENELRGATSETGGPGEISILNNVYSSRFFDLLEQSLGLEGLPK